MASATAVRTTRSPEGSRSVVSRLGSRPAMGYIVHKGVGKAVGRSVRPTVGMMAEIHTGVDWVLGKAGRRVVRASSIESLLRHARVGRGIGTVIGFVRGLPVERVGPPWRR